MSDDVRRAATLCLGLVLMVHPRIVSLLVMMAWLLAWEICDSEGEN